MLCGQIRPLGLLLAPAPRVIARRRPVDAVACRKFVAGHLITGFAGMCWAITTGTGNWPPDMWQRVAAVFTIWSAASRLKLQVMTSTIGRMPTIAAPASTKLRAVRAK